MARERSTPPDPESPDWERVLRLFRAGSPEFVAQIRLFTNAAVARALRREVVHGRPPRGPAAALRVSRMTAQLAAARTARQAPLQVRRQRGRRCGHGPLPRRARPDDSPPATEVTRWNYRTRRAEQRETDRGAAGHGAAARRPALRAAVVRGESRAVRRGQVPVLGQDAALPPPPRVAVLPQARQAASGPLRPRGVHGAQALHRRGHAERSRAARQLGAGPHPVPPLADVAVETATAGASRRAGN